ncbi:MAG: Chaperone SurA [Anaerolineales bacterium]|nr:Chaperone SurA [Anaerolineales bacterium]
MFPQLKTKFTATLFLLVVLLSACSLPIGPPADTPTPSFTSTPEPPTATPVPGIATVNGEVIPLADYDAELARYKSAQAALGVSFTDQDAAQIVLDDLIDQTLLAQAARQAGLSVSESDLQSRVDALAQSIGGAEQLSAWISAHGYTDEAFRSALRRAAEAALMRDAIVAEIPGTVEQVHARQILLYNADEANAVLAQLNGGATFDSLAAFYDPLARGELGWFPRGYLLEPAIEEAAFALQAGGYSGVIQTQAGFHIIFVIERAERSPSPDASLVLQEKAVRDWLTAKRAEAQIVLSQ